MTLIITSVLFNSFIFFICVYSQVTTVTNVWTDDFSYASDGYGGWSSNVVTNGDKKYHGWYDQAPQWYRFFKCKSNSYIYIDFTVYWGCDFESGDYAWFQFAAASWEGFNYDNSIWYDVVESAASSMSCYYDYPRFKGHDLSFGPYYRNGGVTFRLAFDTEMTNVLSNEFAGFSNIVVRCQSTKSPTPQNPTARPTPLPTPQPTPEPTLHPTPRPTPQPTQPTPNPSPQPTPRPTPQPTSGPTPQPSRSPSKPPSKLPTASPSSLPTVATQSPSDSPTSDPTVDPTHDPTTNPTIQPTQDPTDEPSHGPTKAPSKEPTRDPTVDPTGEPTIKPTDAPSQEPSEPPEDSDDTGDDSNDDFITNLTSFTGTTTVVVLIILATLVCLLGILFLGWRMIYSKPAKKQSHDLPVGVKVMSLGEGSTGFGVTGKTPPSLFTLNSLSSENNVHNIGTSVEFVASVPSFGVMPRLPPPIPAHLAQAPVKVKHLAQQPSKVNVMVVGGDTDDGIGNDGTESDSSSAQQHYAKIQLQMAVGRNGPGDRIGNDHGEVGVRHYSDNLTITSEGPRSKKVMTHPTHGNTNDNNVALAPGEFVIDGDD